MTWAKVVETGSSVGDVQCMIRLILIHLRYIFVAGEREMDTFQVGYFISNSAFSFFLIFFKLKNI